MGRTERFNNLDGARMGMYNQINAVDNPDMTKHIPGSMAQYLEVRK
ncbi:MAG: hypothetical protein LBD50_01625 [Rickettsiales bacterium]|jgi:hypothetical protein|nr:hypothetical protein [Rickettsiales bacterium]